MAENDGPTHVAYKSAVTGKFVTRKFAEKHPRTTYKDTIPDHVTSVDTNDALEDEAAHIAAAAEADKA